MAASRKRIRVTVLVALLVIVGLLLWDLDWLTPLIDSRVSTALGREVTIAHLRMHWARNPTLVVQDIHVAEPAGFASDKDFATLATELLSGKYAGKVVLVSWHHGSLPGFAKALGAVPPYDPWPETQFDRVWRIDYKDGKAMLTDLPQGLMAGDSK